MCIHIHVQFLILFCLFFIAIRLTQSENTNAQLENIIATLRASFRTFYSKKDEYEENSKKIFDILLDTMYQLTQEINFCETNADEVNNFL